jgi:two-component system OmpR family response regulator
VILLAEDDDGLARIYQQILRTNGYETRWFTHGKQVLDFLKYEKPDLVVLDLILPDMNGLCLSRQIRESGYEGPMIAISGEIKLEPDQRAMFAGTFLKPLSLKELLGAVRQAIPDALPAASGEA